MLTLLSKRPVSLAQRGKMLRYCRQTLGERGKRWDYDGGFQVRFNFKEEKDIQNDDCYLEEDIY